jgi:PhnB protein
MTTVNIYLTFKGNCKEAFDFYKSVFGRDFQYVGKYGEAARREDLPFDDHEKDKIMHITLPISNETMLMGNDSLEAHESSMMINSNFAIYIRTDSKEEADILFHKLSKGGQVTMPMKETFWGSYYGMIRDKFGINWKMSVDLNDRK